MEVSSCLHSENKSSLACTCLLWGWDFAPSFTLSKAVLGSLGLAQGSMDHWKLIQCNSPSSHITVQFKMNSDSAKAFLRNGQ